MPIHHQTQCINFSIFIGPLEARISAICVDSDGPHQVLELCRRGGRLDDVADSAGVNRTNCPFRQTQAGKSAGEHHTLRVGHEQFCDISNFSRGNGGPGWYQIGKRSHMLVSLLYFRLQSARSYKRVVHISTISHEGYRLLHPRS